MRLVICAALVSWLALCLGAVAEEVAAIDMSAFRRNTGGGDSSWVRGWEFEVPAAITVTHIGILDATSEGPAKEVPVCIWAVDGKEVVKAVVAAGQRTPRVGGCRMTPTPSTQLPPGRYVIGALYARDCGLLDSFCIPSKFISAHEVRWIRAMDRLTDNLEVPQAYRNKLPEFSGEFGPNFMISVDRQTERKPDRYYRLIEAEQVTTTVVRESPAIPENLMHDPAPTTITVFADASGQLTQILLDGEPLGVGDDAYTRLAERIKQANPPSYPRPLIRVACWASVKATDLRRVMSTAARAKPARPRTMLLLGSATDEPGRGCDVISLLDANQFQRSREGVYVAADRFRDAKEYVEDRWTGLLWQKDGEDSQRLSFDEAANYAKTQRLGGVAGWRLPTAEELGTIFPANFAPFTNTPFSPVACCASIEEEASRRRYWTSHRDERPGIVNFVVCFEWSGAGGLNSAFAATRSAFVRCVRGPLEPHEQVAERNAIE